MREWELLNTFFNIVFQNEPACVRDLTSSYEYLVSFCEWLEKRHINCEPLKQIQEKEFRLLNTHMSLSDMEMILHIPLQCLFDRCVEHYQNDLHILCLPGFQEDLQLYDYDAKVNEHTHIYVIEEAFQKKNLSFFDPFPSFLCAINHADQWPGILAFQGKQDVFIPIHSHEDYVKVIQHVEQGHDIFMLYHHFENDLYMIQLSDLHLGPAKKEKGLKQLYNSLDTVIPRLCTHKQLQFLITGDLMDSPNRKNMYMANDCMNYLKKRYKAKVTFILGNHDMIVHGLNIARRQKSKVIAYLLGENIRILENEKIIFIKMNTCSEGNLARGKVGQRQLDEIDDELSAIENIKDYTLIVLLHHHVYPLDKAQFIKTKWHEKTFISRIIETSKVLVDAPLLIDWLEKRHIHYIFHGHKHLPYFRNQNGYYYIGAGSATGSLKESKSRYISYNIVRYNTEEKKMKTCMIFYDDKAKAERQRIEVNLFEEDTHENC